MRLPLINFISWPLIAALPLDLLGLLAGPAFLSDNGIASLPFQRWLLIENSFLALQAILAASVFMIVFRRKSGDINLEYRDHSYNYLLVGGILFLLIFIVSFVITSSLGFGLLNWIKSPRTGYQFHRDSVGPFYALMTISINVSSSLFLFYFRKSKISLLLTLISMMPLFYLLGSKGMMLNLFLMSTITYLIQFNKMPITLIVVGGIMVSILILINFGSADLFDIFSYFDYYPNTIITYDALSNHRMAFFEGRISFSEIWAIVPRGLYPDKPYVYGSVILSDLLYPGLAAQGHTVGFGGPIHAYADFGLPGVFASAIVDPALMLRAVLLGFIARLYLRGGGDAVVARPSAVVILIFLFNPGAIQFLAFPLDTIYLAIVLATLAAGAWALSQWKVGKSGYEKAGPPSATSTALSRSDR